MGGFLSGLGEILGGFNTQRRIDKEGFDFREKQAAQQFARDREVQLAGQADEDRNVSQIADVLATQEGEPDTSSIPEKVLGANAKWNVQRAMGQLPERKSSLAAMAANTALTRQAIAGDQRLAQIGLTAAEAKDRDALNFKRKQGAVLSPAEEAKLATLERIANTREAGAQRRFDARGTTGKLSYTPATVNEEGEAGRWGLHPDGTREWFPAAPTVTMRDTAGMAGGIQDSLQEMKDAAEKGVLNGPVIGKLSQWWQAAYPSGAEGEFDSAAKRLVDIVYTKSGKQINAQELQILKGLIPTRARGNIDFQIQEFDRYVDQLMSKYAGGRRGGSGGPGKPRRKYNPATGMVE